METFLGIDKKTIEEKLQETSGGSHIRYFGYKLDRMTMIVNNLYNHPSRKEEAIRLMKKEIKGLLISIAVICTLFGFTEEEIFKS